MNNYNTELNKRVWLNSKEASIYLGITYLSLRSMICRGQIKAYKLNNRNRFNREELDYLIRSSIKGNKR